MNKVMNVIANKIIDLLRGRPALKVGEVSVWGDFSHDEKERLRLILLDGRNAKEREKEFEERVAWLENIVTDYTGKFMKAQDALKYAALMSEEDKEQIAILQSRLAVPIQLPDINDERFELCGMFNQVKYRNAVVNAIRSKGFFVEGIGIKVGFRERKAARVRAAGLHSEEPSHEKA